MQVKNRVNEQTNEQKKTFASIETKSFIVVVVLLGFLLAVSGILSHVIPQGSFLRDESGAIIEGSYTRHEEQGGISLWRVITAPFRVYVSEDATMIIMISAFLLIMSGIFNLLEKTNGTKVVISRLMSKLADKGAPVVCLCVLTFMLFGSFFGMFEELVTLLPLIVAFMLSMKMDTMTGLGACLLAACFGFSAAITNPFSVGLAAEVAGISLSDGMWLRLVFFGIVYATLCIFLMVHLKRIERNPALSPSYETDVKKREALGDSVDVHHEGDEKLFKLFTVFFSVQAAVLVLVATVRAISSLAIPILSASFLGTSVVVGYLATKNWRRITRYLLDGAISMLPAILMIALASSVKLVMTESGIIDTIMNSVINLLLGKSKFLAIILIYFLILFLQVFIGSASAKIILVMPIVMPIATALGLTPTLVILAYCMADGFTDVILPTNPILLVALSIANVSYAKWVKWTWKLQTILFILSGLFLLFGVAIGY